MDAIVELRRDLHRNPELSGFEAKTARTIIRFFKDLHPDLIVDGIGGNGFAIVFSGSEPGPTVLLRSELDALPIQEANRYPWRSINHGISHQCGHDGHMAILAAVGLELSTNRPAKGRVVLLYQPAEETGEGAAAVIRDPKFQEIKPDFAFALHNLPGFDLGQVVLRAGAFNCASRGIEVHLSGATAHAAQPLSGLSPASAMCQIIERLSNLPEGLVPPGEMGFATVVGSRLGDKAYGTAPGHADVWATLRSESDDTMERIIEYVKKVISQSATADGLDYGIKYEDIFQATINSREAVDIVRRAAGQESVVEIEKPFPWSEDFGCFTAISKGALIGIGAGKGVAELHHPDYDFPEELIRPAAAILRKIVRLTWMSVST